MPQIHDIARHYLLLGYRNISKHLLISVATIAGYALAISILLPVILLLLEQGQYDNFTGPDENIYRVTTGTNGNEYKWATSPMPLAQHLRENLSNVKSVHSLYPKDLKVSVNDINSFLVRGAFVDEKFFDIFKLSDKSSEQLGLSRPFSILLTEDAAIKLFGSKQVVGSVVTIDSVGEVVVTGILPVNKVKSHIDYEAYLSSSTFQIMANKNDAYRKDLGWSNYQSTYTYIIVHSDISKSAINIALNEVAQSLFSTKVFDNPSVRSLSFNAQPIKSVISGDFYEDTLTVRVQQRPAIFVVVGLILFSLASINYLNLFVTRASMRIKEFGVRRIFGVNNWHVFVQFIAESIILLSVSSILGLALMVILPITQIQSILHSSTLGYPFFLILLAFTIILGTAAGLIPSFFVAGLKITTSLTVNARSVKVLGAGFQKILLVLQICSSIIVSIVLFVFISQSNFMRDSNYGFQMHDLLSLDLQGNKGEILKIEMERLAEIKSTSLTSDNFGMMPEVIGVRNPIDSVQGFFFMYSADDSFLDLFGLKLIAGKNFGINGGFESEIIINEAAVNALSYKWPRSAIGESIVVNDTVNSVVIGVIKDFNFDNFKRPILPLIIRNKPKDGRYLIIEAKDETQLKTLENEISLIWMKIVPNLPIKVDEYEEMFKERQTHRNDLLLLSVIAIYTVVISFLGLLGMTMHSMNLRAKEISIHKVFGANRAELINLLAKDFGRLFLIAIIISATAAFFICNSILQQFAYKIDLTFSIFLVPVLFVMFFAFGIVILRSLYITSIDPVKSLRHE